MLPKLCGVRKDVSLGVEFFGKITGSRFDGIELAVLLNKQTSNLLPPFFCKTILDFIFLCYIETIFAPGIVPWIFL